MFLSSMHTQGAKPTPKTVGEAEELVLKVELNVTCSACCGSTKNFWPKLASDHAL